MRIGFDLRPFLKEETGVGVYYKNLLFSLSRIDRSNEYFLFSSSLKDRFEASKIPPFEKKSFRDFALPVKMVNYFWYRLRWPSLDFFFHTKLDLTHSPTPLILPTKGKKIVTVYDLCFLDFPHLTDKETRRNFLHRTGDSLLQADGIVTISRFTRDQLLEKFGVEKSKVKVVYLGIDPDYGQDVSADELAKTESHYSLPSSFLLFVGALERRKNLLNLIQALKTIHRHHKKIHLVIAGREGEEYYRLKDEIRRQSLESWIKMLGYVPDTDLKNLYRLASLLVFPSFCEGFGLPVLEAMASGLPVVASKTSAIEEVAQDAALYFDPQNPEEMAEKILLALEDKSLCQKNVERGKKRALDFNWEKTATETLGFYQEMVGR
jgi:glycosyltransferase involved in cell wall biosynthesis